MAGDIPEHVEILHHNVALHARVDGVQISYATPPQLRHVQHKPRLGPDMHQEGVTLSADPEVIREDASDLPATAFHLYSFSCYAEI